MKISKIILYDEPAVPELSLGNVADYVEKVFNIKTAVERNIFHHAAQKTAEEVASCKIFDFRAPFVRHVPTPEEVEIEKKSFSDSTNQNIVLYDGFELQKVITSLIPAKEQAAGTFHIVFTNKLACTFDFSDLRYHGRALIAANPSIVSTTGIIEAPAKPRQYYLDLMANYWQGLNVNTVKKKYQGSYLEYHDERLAAIVQGYCMQALFYHLTGEAFCDLLDCRLYNAHWQRDLLYSQLECGKLCERHAGILRLLHNFNC